LELGLVLARLLITVGQHAGLGVVVAQPLPGNAGEHDCLAGIMGNREISHQVELIATWTLSVK
jgi:hypothetical protein